MTITEERNPMLFNKIEAFRTNNLERFCKNSKLAKQIEMICLEEADHGTLSVNEKTVEKFFDNDDGDYWGIKAGVAWLQTKLHEHNDEIDVMGDDLSPIYKDLEINYFGPCIMYGVTYYGFDKKRIDYAFRSLFRSVKDLMVINSYLVSNVVLPKHHDQYLALFRIMSAIQEQEWLYSYGTFREAHYASCSFERDMKRLLVSPEGVEKVKNIYMMIYKAAQYIAPAYMEQWLIEDGRPLPKWTINTLYRYLMDFILEETNLPAKAKESIINSHFEDTRSYERVLKELYRRTSKKYNETIEKLVDAYLQHQ